MKKEDVCKVINILNSFNFHRVHKNMKMLNWKWYIEDSGETRVPYEIEIRTKASEILMRLLEEKELGKKDFIISTGGLKGILDDGDFGLEFVLEEWYE